MIEGSFETELPREEVEQIMAADYSQSGEQALIFRAVEACGIDQGRFLDIGAGDGETFSNTRALALAGWGGTVVEPAAWAFDRLVDLYAERHDVMPVCAVVTPEIMGLVTFSYSKDDHVSSMVPAHIAKWRSVVPFRQVLAAAVTLDELLVGCASGFEFVSIDAEGLTTELLKAYQRHPAWGRVRVVCFERDPVPATLPAWQGWELVGKTPNNVVYRRAV